MPFADISDGISLHYDRVGLTGSPLFLISGFGTAMVDWPPAFLATLQEAHRLILVDNRGMGRSSGPMDLLDGRRRGRHRGRLISWR